MSAQTAITEYITAANGIRFAYRRVGPDQTGVPLVMHIHFRANMDLWDPLLVNTLIKQRQVILFDNAGVGRSTGEVPTSFQGWANDVIAFVEALGLKKIDLLGFSMGGFCVQMVALTRPDLVRKLIIAGSTAAPPLAEKVAGVVWPRENADMKYVIALANSVTVDEGAESIFYSFFYDDINGREAFDGYWKRLKERTAEPLKLELLDKDLGAKRQIAAISDAEIPIPRNPFDRLEELKMPVLVANGDQDLLIPTSRSWELLTQIANAQLTIYPRAGHGFIWQYAELFAKHINLFLGGTEFDNLLSRL